MKEKLTISKLKTEAKVFCVEESKINNKSLFGITDEKVDDPKRKTATLNFVSCSFISKERTADYTTTFRLREMLKDKANAEDIIAYLIDKNIPADEITLNELAKQILNSPPEQGYLTISNALQWRLQYQRIVTLEKSVKGITKIIDKVSK